MDAPRRAPDIAPDRSLPEPPAGQGPSALWGFARSADTLLLMLGMALTLLAVWTAYLVHGADERREAVEATLERNQNLAISLEQYTIRVIQLGNAVAQYLGREYGRGTRGEQLVEILQDRVRANEILQELMMVDATGRRIASSSAHSVALPDVSSSEFYRAHLQAGPPTRIGQPFAAQETGKLMLPVSRAIRGPGGELHAVVVVFVECSRLAQVFKDAQVRGDTVVALAGRDGRVHAAWDGRSKSAMTGLTQLQDLALLRSEAAVAGRSVTGLDGKPRLVSVRSLKDFPLFTLAGTHEADVLDEHNARERSYLGACIGLTLMLLVLAAALTRMNIRRARMSNALSLAEQRLLSLNADLERQVAERTAQLQVANRDLESFSYSVAHDVRAPLATIDGFSRMLQPAIEAGGDSRLAHYLQRIQASTQQMAELTESLLALATVSRQTVHLQRVDLSDLAASVVATLREREPQRQVEVVIEPGLETRADPVLARQLLENLLGNAWKYTGRREQAHIAFGADPDVAGVPGYAVRDNGAGFDMAYAAKLFQPFQRLHTQQEFRGSGVGLATVRRIVELHGGSVSACGEPGVGATFRFTLRRPAGAA